MKFILDLLDSFFSIQVSSNLNIYDIVSMILKYLFVIIIYYFIFNIIKMIYLDIRGTSNMNYVTNTYLKLINRKEKLAFKVQEHYFIGDKTLIGRDDKCDIVLKDRFVSKRHARIIKDQGIYFIEDLHSANGTFLNGEQIFEVIELKDKDLIDIGQIEFLFVNGDGEDS
ncbi:MAG: FHA domain-containing protein [Tissierellia bacterium]|nr:FHA domain-containing protein [Tissierellia bacterium]